MYFHCIIMLEVNSLFAEDSKLQKMKQFCKPEFSYQRTKALENLTVKN